MALDLARISPIKRLFAFLTVRVKFGTVEGRSSEIINFK